MRIGGPSPYELKCYRNVKSHYDRQQGRYIPPPNWDRRNREIDPIRVRYHVDGMRFGFTRHQTVSYRATPENRLPSLASPLHPEIFLSDGPTPQTRSFMEEDPKISSRKRFFNSVDPIIQTDEGRKRRRQAISAGNTPKNSSAINTNKEPVENRVDVSEVVSRIRGRKKDVLTNSSTRMLIEQHIDGASNE